MNRDLGIRHVDASVVAENERMLKLIRNSGFGFHSYLEDGVRNITVSL